MVAAANRRPGYQTPAANERPGRQVVNSKEKWSYETVTRCQWGGADWHDNVQGRKKTLHGVFL